MRVLTCNVNGIRSAVSKGFWSWASRQKADVLCLQEVRADLDKLPREVRATRSFHKEWFPANRPGYSGVALLSRREPDRVVRGFGCKESDHEGRYLQADFGDLSIVSIYIPSGSNSEARLELKYRVMDRFLPHLEKLARSGRQLIVCGDFNIAHREIDLTNWRSNQKYSGFLPEERAWMDELFGGARFVDGFRAVDPRPERYTWWSNRGRAYEKNVGWRIDYHVVTPDLRDRIKKASIYRERKFSDHAPLILDYDWEL